MRFRIGGTEVFLSFWFFAAAAMFTAINAAAFSLYILLPVIIHELGHIIAIAVCGAKISAVRFTALGLEIEKSKTAKLSFSEGIIVSLAGISANLAFAAGLYFFAPDCGSVMLFTAANIAVAGFNLLPVGNLDGGEVVRALCERYLQPRLAYILSLTFSFAALTPLFAAAIYILLRPERNFTLLLVCICLLAQIATGK